MTDLHPDYRRSRHPYVTAWGSALTNRLTYVCLVTVSNLGTRHWLVFVWSVNTGFPLAKVITVMVAQGGRHVTSWHRSGVSLPSPSTHNRSGNEKSHQKSGSGWCSPHVHLLPFAFWWNSLGCVSKHTFTRKAERIFPFMRPHINIHHCWLLCCQGYLVTETSVSSSFIFVFRHRCSAFLFAVVESGFTAG